MMSLVLSGVLFNDAYRYMNGLVAVLLMLVDINFAMNPCDVIFVKKLWMFVFGSVLKIVLVYYSDWVSTWLKVHAFFLYRYLEVL